MEKWKRRRLISFSFSLGVLIFVFLFYDPLLRAYAELFHRDDGVAYTDSVVVAGGNFTQRLGKAAEHFRTGNAERIAIFLLPVPIDPLVRRFYPGETAISENVLKYGYGITMYDVLSHANGITSTYEEALALRDYCQENGLESVSVVTDAFHSFRAGYVYEKWVGDACRIVILPVYPNNFVTDRWWRNERGIKNYILEPLKLINDVFR
jgi:uncharacterized SAM-binding protein YcdF (DUF218 family)